MPLSQRSRELQVTSQFGDWFSVETERDFRLLQAWSADSTGKAFAASAELPGEGAGAAYDLTRIG